MASQTLLSNSNIGEFCSRWRVAELSLDKNSASDADLGLRVKFEPSAEWSLRDRLRMHREFEALMGKHVRISRERPFRTRRSSYRVLYNA